MKYVISVSGGDRSAGIMPWNDTVTVILESGVPPGPIDDPAWFAKELTEFIENAYDGRAQLETVEVIP